MAKKSKNKVKDQYEDYPYPHRDPSAEKTRLISGSPGQLVELNHYLFKGMRDFTKPFRVLIAGGGTGDAAIMLAQNLVDIRCPAEIHYMDLSEASRRIAEKRAKVRKLDNIIFHTGSLLDISHLGEFDYIDSCGVLHHLPDPQAGFKALAAQLATGGGMGIMVYGTLGRIGVYHAQDMLRMIAGDDKNHKRVDVAKNLIAEMPDTNWLVKNTVIRDHKDNDAGLFDLLLHSQDRAYTVKELDSEVTKAGLKIVTFIDPARYDPDYYIKDAETKARLDKLSYVDRACFTELLSGNMRKHIVYLNKSDEVDTIAKAINQNAVPCYLDEKTAKQFQSMPMGAQPSFDFDGIKFDVNLPPQTAAILRAIDGERTLGDIQRLMQGGPDWLAFSNVFQHIFKTLNDFGKLFIRI